MGKIISSKSNVGLDLLYNIVWKTCTYGVLTNRIYSYYCVNETLPEKQNECRKTLAVQRPRTYNNMPIIDILIKNVKFVKINEKTFPSS